MGLTAGNDKILGTMEIIATAIFTLVLVISAFSVSGFEFGTTEITVLESESAVVAGLLLSAILFAICCMQALVPNKPDGIFVDKIEKIFGIISSVVLIIYVLTESNHIAYSIFQTLVIVTILFSSASSWVTDKKFEMIFSFAVFILLAVSAITNLMAGFAFPIIFAVWAVFHAVLMISSAIINGAEEAKTSTPVPETKKPESATVILKEETPVSRQKPVEIRQAVSTASVAEKKPSAADISPAECASKSAEIVETKQLPTLKVMKSRDAAAARTSTEQKRDLEQSQIHVPESGEFSKTEKSATVSETVSEKIETTEQEHMPETIFEKTEDSESESSDEEYIVSEDTPDALVRRAAWNKGLRCRRDYGDHKIPVAFVKGRVAVYITPFDKDTTSDQVLKSDGWTVLRFDESEITDGKEQGEIIYNSVKENIRSDKAAAKKKKKTH
jgi:hypothetical protein